MASPFEARAERLRQPLTKTYLTISRKTFLAALGLAAVVPGSSRAQAPDLGTTANFAVLSNAGITSIGNTVITGTAALPGDIGSATATITGFPPGLVTPPGVIHPIGDAPTMTALNSLGIAYNNLAARNPTANLTGQDLGGLTLIPGVYNFSSSAQLTGTLNLNALGNPNAVFIFNIGSSLTTASASTVTLLNGAQGGNVFWRVGSSATLGTTTSFTGDILAQASITLNTGSRITCGAAWARTGAVTLDTNTITVCDLIGAGLLGPVGAPAIVSLLLPSATANQRSVANAIDAFAGNGGLLPLAFINLFNLSAGDLGNALGQLSGENSTGIAPAGTQAMNSFLSLVTNPFADNRGWTPVSPPSPAPRYAKVPFHKAAGPVADPRRWNVWGAAYGGQTNTSGNAFDGSHDRSARSYGFATGLDYRVWPYTVVGFALAGGNTRYGLSDGLGGGHSDMFQAAVYSLTRVGAAYVSGALAYGWHQVTTDRILTVAGLDRLTAGFAANNIGGRIEGGYRFAIPGVYELPGFGFTPYAAFQMQAFRTPSYSEVAVSGSSMFALDYQAHTTTTTRTELGAWVDRSMLLYPGAMLSLRGRAAWAHDHWSDTNMTAGFQSLPGSSFTVIGATPVKDSLLVSAVAEVTYRNGISVAGKFDTEQAAHSQTYVGTARLRYAW